MKDTEITIVNKDRLDLYKEGTIKKYELVDNEEKVVVEGTYINGRYAEKIRDGLYKKIKIYIEK